MSSATLLQLAFFEERDPDFLPENSVRWKGEGEIEKKAKQTDARGGVCVCVCVSRARTYLCGYVCVFCTCCYRFVRNYICNCLTNILRTCPCAFYMLQ